MNVRTINQGDAVSGKRRKPPDEICLPRFGRLREEIQRLHDESGVKGVRSNRNSTRTVCTAGCIGYTDTLIRTNSNNSHTTTRDVTKNTKTHPVLRLR